MSPTGEPRHVIFLDRDGTLVRDTGYVHRLDDCRLLPGVSLGLTRLRDAGFRFVIVTNQSGIGRGLYDETAFEAFQRELRAQLARDGIEIDGTFHCPHRPEDRCDCRKPAPGLLLRARETLGLDLARSWMIGDAARDVEAALAAGCAGAVQLVDALPPDAPSTNSAFARNLPDAAEIILRWRERVAKPGPAD